MFCVLHEAFQAILKYTRTVHIYENDIDASSFYVFVQFFSLCALENLPSQKQLKKISSKTENSWVLVAPNFFWLRIHEITYTGNWQPDFILSL